MGDVSGARARDRSQGPEGVSGLLGPGARPSRSEGRREKSGHRAALLNSNGLKARVQPSLSLEHPEGQAPNHGRGERELRPERESSPE
jgi:hypothetical protein